MRPVIFQRTVPSVLVLFLVVSCIAQAAVPEVDRSVDAKAMVSELAAQDFQKVADRFDPAMTKALPVDKLRAVWDGIVAQAGSFKSQGSTRTERQGTYDIVYVTCQFERATLEAKVVFDADGKIGGLFFVPPAQSATAENAPYVSPDSLEEVELTFGTEPWLLPGTLAVPKGDGPFPAMVLVHGSGPQDRDETVGANKPFRDLARGLASRGIAVLRYEKRTLQHANQLKPLPSPFTVNEETIDDAIDAVNALAQRPRIDDRRVFVLGHSLGGTLIPRIAVRAENAAGFIILAGATRPLEDVIMEQTNYLALLDGEKSVDDLKRINAMQDQVNQIKKLSETDATDPAIVFGAPASYWLDLRAHDPALEAKEISKPLLVLQGERDYQVTMSNFDQWKKALAEKRSVTFKAYPGLNHLFVEGEGPGNPGEYAVPGHVAPEVVDDIARWVKP